MLVCAESVSDEVETVTVSPEEVVAGFETWLAVTSTVWPAAMVQPPATVKVTMAPPSLVTQLFNPHCVAVVTSSIV